MAGIIGPFKPVTTNAAPLEGHVAHLRHLSKPGSARLILRKRFGFSANDARDSGNLIASHVAQGIEFHDAARVASLRVRPVLQYYSHLNFAVAAVLAYRPPNYRNYRRHGVCDVTSDVKQLKLVTPVVRITTGAVTLFNDVISRTPLPINPLRLIHLMSQVPMLSMELEDAFGIKAHSVRVTEQLVRPNGKEYRTRITFSTYEDENGSSKKLPVGALKKSMPSLKQTYRRVESTPYSCTYESKTAYSASVLREAEDSHRNACLEFMNYGGHLREDLDVVYMWRYLPRYRILPTMTASLLLSFAWASICRYRPQLLGHLAESRLNLLADVFVGECDSYMLPAFRNLLYREEAVITNHGSI